MESNEPQQHFHSHTNDSIHSLV